MPPKVGVDEWLQPLSAPASRARLKERDQLAVPLLDIKSVCEAVLQPHVLFARKKPWARPPLLLHHQTLARHDLGLLDVTIACESKG